MTYIFYDFINRPIPFDKLMNLMCETEHMNGYANFAYALRTGILLMFELFSSENKRPFTDRKSRPRRIELNGKSP